MSSIHEKSSNQERSQISDNEKALGAGGTMIVPPRVPGVAAGMNKAQSSMPLRSRHSTGMGNDFLGQKERLPTSGGGRVETQEKQE